MVATAAPMPEDAPVTSATLAVKSVAVCMAHPSRPPSTRATTKAASFTRRVLQLVSLIPAGRVATYGDVAARAGHPRAARAVGNIMRTARQPGLPYHRVVAAGGRIGGYGSSPQLKRALLLAEGHQLRGQRIAGFAGRRWSR